MVVPLKVAILGTGLPQYTVAARASISETRLSRLAKGRARATDEELARLASVLGVAPHALIPQEAAR